MPTKVPVVEPRSWTKTPSLTAVTRAWRRETVGRSIECLPPDRGPRWLHCPRRDGFPHRRRTRGERSGAAIVVPCARRSVWDSTASSPCLTWRAPLKATRAGAEADVSSPEQPSGQESAFGNTAFSGVQTARRASLRHSVSPAPEATVTSRHSRRAPFVGASAASHGSEFRAIITDHVHRRRPRPGLDEARQARVLAPGPNRRDPRALRRHGGQSPAGGRRPLSALGRERDPDRTRRESRREPSARFVDPHADLAEPGSLGKARTDPAHGRGMGRRGSPVAQRNAGERPARDARAPAAGRRDRRGTRVPRPRGGVRRCGRGRPRARRRRRVRAIAPAS